MKHPIKISQIYSKGLYTLFALLAIVCLLGNEPMHLMLQDQPVEQATSTNKEEQDLPAEATLADWQVNEAIVPILNVNPQQLLFITSSFEYFTPLKEFALEVCNAPPLMLRAFYKILFRNFISPNAP